MEKIISRRRRRKKKGDRCIGVSHRHFRLIVLDFPASEESSRTMYMCFRFTYGNIFPQWRNAGAKPQPKRVSKKNIRSKGGRGVKKYTFLGVGASKKTSLNCCFIIIEVFYAPVIRLLINFDHLFPRLISLSLCGAEGKRESVILIKLYTRVLRCNQIDIVSDVIL